MFVTLLVAASIMPQGTGWAPDYAGWYKSLKAKGTGTIMIGFKGCAPCAELKGKLDKIAEEGKENLLYLDKDNKDVEKYKLKAHMKPPMSKNSYPTLVRFKKIKGKFRIKYLQGNPKVERLRKFLKGE